MTLCEPVPEIGVQYKDSPANKIHQPNAGLILAHLRIWHNPKPVLRVFWDRAGEICLTVRAPKHQAFNLNCVNEG